MQSISFGTINFGGRSAVDFEKVKKINVELDERPREPTKKYNW
ncbi:MAG: hypothetical protein ACP5MI_08870 [Candidatus Kryptoniota bacterium]